MPMATPEAQREYNRLWYARRRAEWFAGKECFRCHSTVDLRLDHIDPATKVSHSIWSWSQERRDAELAKCQVLCESCHRWKTKGCEEHAQGEANGHARLTENDVLAIRRRYSQGGITLASLGIEYGVCRENIWRIVRRMTWKHL